MSDGASVGTTNLLGHYAPLDLHVSVISLSPPMDHTTAMLFELCAGICAGMARSHPSATMKSSAQMVHAPDGSHHQAKANPCERHTHTR